jgi:ribosomal 50S subunit-associated protein YjgA (DUF615 family)
MDRDDHFDALERRRARLAEDAEVLADLIDVYPTAEARRLLKCLASEIDTLDRIIAGRRDSAA